MKRLWSNLKAEEPIMKWTMVIACLLFGIVIGACTKQVRADDNSDTFNGVHLHSPMTGGTLDRVDDGTNQCYFFYIDNKVSMSCVNTREDRGSDEQQ